VKRVLFVDDEVNVLEGLADMLRRNRGEWQMSFALGAEAALGELHSGGFDIVVSDLRMPGLDGAELLRRVRDRHPDTIRIILSGHTAEEAALRAVPYAHQFLAKPCSSETLKGVIDRTCRLRDMLKDDAVRSTVTELGGLPSLPAVCQELTGALGNPEVTVRDVATIIGHDPAMCAKILQLVNSAFFGLGREITEVSNAVSYLGLSTVRALVLSLGVFESLDGRPETQAIAEQLQRHAVATATLAARIAGPRADGAFLAGMLHDIGVLALAVCRPGDSARIAERASREERPRHELEVEEIGASHAEIGAYLLSLWGLPYSVVEAVAFHHGPASGAGEPFGLPGAVHVADALLYEAAYGDGRGGVLDLGYVEGAGVSSLLAEWRKLAQSIGSVEVPTTR
jgi:HD-like signal output (HDOD) protein